MSWIDRIRGAAESATEAAEDAGDDVGDAFDEAGDTVRDVTHGDYSGGYRDALDRIRDRAGQAVDQTQETADEAVDQVQDTTDNVSSGVDETIDRAQNTADETVDQVQDTADNVSSGVDETVDRAQNTAEDTSQNVRDTAKDVASDARDKAEDVASNVDTATQNVRDTASNVASDVEETVDKAQDVTRNVQDTAEEAVDASQDTADEAVDRTQDLSRGVREVVSDPSGAAEDLASDAQNIAQEAADDPMERVDRVVREEYVEPAAGSWNTDVDRDVTDTLTNTQGWLDEGQEQTLRKIQSQAGEGYIEAGEAAEQALDEAGAPEAAGDFVRGIGEGAGGLSKAAPSAVGLADTGSEAVGQADEAVKQHGAVDTATAISGVVGTVGAKTAGEAYKDPGGFVGEVATGFGSGYIGVKVASKAAKTAPGKAVVDSAKKVPRPGIETYNVDGTRGVTVGIRNADGPVGNYHSVGGVVGGRPQAGTPNIDLEGKTVSSDLNPGETAAVTKALRDMGAPNEAKKIEAFRDVQKQTQKSDLAPNELETVVGDVLEQHGAPRSSASDVLKMTSDEGGAIYGSITQKSAAQGLDSPGLGREPRDIDIDDLSDKNEFGQEVTKRINREAGEKVVEVEDGVPKSKETGEKVFDLHEAGEQGAEQVREERIFGIKHESDVEASGVRTTTLSEQGARKGEGAMKEISGDPRTVGGNTLRVGPKHEGRFKDVQDFADASRANIEYLGTRRPISSRRAKSALDEFEDAWDISGPRKTPDNVRTRLGSPSPDSPSPRSSLGGGSAGGLSVGAFGSSSPSPGKSPDSSGSPDIGVPGFTGPPSSPPGSKQPGNKKSGTPPSSPPSDPPSDPIMPGYTPPSSPPSDPPGSSPPGFTSSPPTSSPPSGPTSEPFSPSPGPDDVEYIPPTSPSKSNERSRKKKQERKYEQDIMFGSSSGGEQVTPGLLTETFLGFAGLDVEGREVKQSGQAYGEYSVGLSGEEEAQFEQTLGEFGLDGAESGDFGGGEGWL